MKKVESDRMELAVLAVLYEIYPLFVSQEEVIKIIKKRGLLKMTEEEFKEYSNQIIISKEN